MTAPNATSDKHVGPAFPFGQSVATLCTVGAGGGSIAGLICLSLDRMDLMVPASTMLGICVLAAIAGLWPVAKMAARSADGVALGFMAGFAIRGLTVGIGAAVCMAISERPSQQWLLFAAVWYLLLLCAEVYVIYRYLISAEPSAVEARA